MQLQNTFDEAEIARLKENLKLSYTERFRMAMRLYRIKKSLEKAVITHQPFISK